MRRRFWLAVMRYAMKRTGLRRYTNPEPTDAEWAAYAEESREWAEASFPLAAEAWPLYEGTTTTTGNITNITWTYR
jgi:hypothetical protein